MPQCVEPPPPPPPLDQALRQFTGRAILYTQHSNILLIGDTDSGASLWINSASCPPHSTSTVHGAWSADGQFIAFSCRDDRSWSIHLLNMLTADVRQIAQGDAAQFVWSPTDHSLLVAEQTKVQRAFVLDAATNATAALPFAPLWELIIGPNIRGVGQAIPLEDSTAAMAWSPDGTRIAVIGECMCLLDADMAHARDGKLATLIAFEGGFIRRPRWSHDQRFLYTVEPHQNHNNPLSPSSMFGVRTLRTEISTGVITSTYPIEPLWSPDQKAYLELSELGIDSPRLYWVDGTLTHVITGSISSDLFWTPDSQHILFQRYNDQDLQIVAIDLDGHERIILTANDPANSYGLFNSPIAPDSQLFAFAIDLSIGTPDEHYQIVIYDFQGHQRARFEGEDMLGWRAGR